MSFKNLVRILLIITSFSLSLLNAGCILSGEEASASTDDPLNADLRDDDPRIRVEAVRQLAVSGNAEAVGLLLEALSDSDESVSDAAADALERIGRPAIRPLLATLLRERRRSPILEFDPAERAIIEPSEVILPIDVPERCVICFFAEVVKKLSNEPGAKTIYARGGEDNITRYIEIEFNGERLAVVYPGVGAPLAADTLEMLIAFGCRKFIACGGAGALRDDIGLGKVVVPVSAVRDEGTSYHYLPADREVTASREGMAAIEKVLNGRGVDYIIGKTWTTDAFSARRLRKQPAAGTRAA